MSSPEDETTIDPRQMEFVSEDGKRSINIRIDSPAMEQLSDDVKDDLVSILDRFSLTVQKAIENPNLREHKLSVKSAVSYIHRKIMDADHFLMNRGRGIPTNG